MAHLSPLSLLPCVWCKDCLVQQHGCTKIAVMSGGNRETEGVERVREKMAWWDEKKKTKKKHSDQKDVGKFKRKSSPLVKY